jgi:hypothetical protein
MGDSDATDVQSKPLSWKFPFSNPPFENPGTRHERQMGLRPQSCLSVVGACGIPIADRMARYRVSRFEVCDEKLVVKPLEFQHFRQGKALKDEIYTQTIASGFRPAPQLPDQGPHTSVYRAHISLPSLGSRTSRPGNGGP